MTVEGQSIEALAYFKSILPSSFAGAAARINCWAFLVSFVLKYCSRKLKKTSERRATPQRKCIIIFSGTPEKWHSNPGCNVRTVLAALHLSILKVHS